MLEKHLAYANSVKQENPVLAKDIIKYYELEKGVK